MRARRTRTGSVGARGRQGGVLVMALMVVLAVTMLAGGFLQIATSVGKRQRHAADTKQALYLAEAGLAEGYIGLGVAKTGNVGTPEQPATFGDGLFWVEATAVGADRIELQSTALWGAGRATLGLVAERVEVNMSTLGIFSNSDVTLGPGSYLDSYDSSAGTYADQLAAGVNNDRGALGSNGAITLDGDVVGLEVRGDVTPGQGETVTETGTVTVTGSTVAAATPHALPPVEVPTGVVMQPGINHTSGVPLVISAGESGFQSIEVGSNSEVIVVGPATLVVGTMLLNTDATFRFDVTAGPIDVYVTESLDIDPGSTLTNTAQDPTKVTVQVVAPTPGDNNVNLTSAAQFFGTIYAPRSAVGIGGDFELFGAAIAETLNIGAGVQLHFDLAFNSLQNTLPTFEGWRVVDIPTGIATKGGDPFVLLGLDPTTLPSPAMAHQDQQLVIDYRDGAGVLKHYNGLESGFDWKDVTEVVSATRDGEAVRAVKTSSSSSGEPAEPPPSPPPGTPTDWIADGGIDSATLLGYLLDAAPLTTAELDQALFRNPPLDSLDLLALMEAHTPLSSAVVGSLFWAQPNLNSAQRGQLLVLNSPLANGHLASAISCPHIDDADLRDVLIASSPLTGGTLNTLNSADPPMNQADYDMVMAAQ